MTIIIAKNQTAGALALKQLPVPNQEIPASGQVTLTDYASVTEIQNDLEITAYIVADSLLLNIDGNDQTKAQSLAAQSPVTFPVDDTTELVRDPATTTKRVRLDAGAVTASTTRVMSMPDQDVNLAPNTGTFPSAAHASRHQHGGADEVATVTPGANAIPKAKIDGTIDIEWLPASVQAPGKLTPGVFGLGNIVNYLSVGAAGSASEIQYTRKWLVAGTVITKMGYFVSTGGSAARFVRLGIYDQADPKSESGIPVTRVAQTNSVDTNVGDAVHHDVPLIASYSVPTTGYYWLAFIIDSTVTKVAITNPTPAMFLPIRREVGTGTTLPATAGTLTWAAGAVAWVAAKE